MLSYAVGLGDDEVNRLNLSFLVLALADQAMKDGAVSRAERSELASIAALLTIYLKVVPALLDRAEIAGEQHLGANLQPLPEGWTCRRRRGSPGEPGGCRSGAEDAVAYLTDYFSGSGRLYILLPSRREAFSRSVPKRP